MSAAFEVDSEADSSTVDDTGSSGHEHSPRWRHPQARKTGPGVTPPRRALVYVPGICCAKTTAMGHHPLYISALAPRPDTSPPHVSLHGKVRCQTGSTLEPSLFKRSTLHSSPSQGQISMMGVVELTRSDTVVILQYTMSEGISCVCIVAKSLLQSRSPPSSPLQTRPSRPHLNAPSMPQ